MINFSPTKTGGEIGENFYVYVYGTILLYSTVANHHRGGIGHKT